MTEADHDAPHDALIARARHSSVRQASGYASALRLYGHGAEIYRDGSGEFGALLSVKRFPFGGARIRTSGGLAILDSRNVEGYRRFLAGLVDHARKSGAAVLELSLREPRRRFVASLVERDPDIDHGVSVEETILLEEVLREAGFVHLREQGTYAVSLRRDSDDALLDSFSKNARRDVRLAERRGVTVELRRDSAAFELFEGAHRAMMSRKGLETVPVGLVREVLYRLSERHQGELFVASFEGVPRNFLFVSSIGEPVYQWGAAAPASHEGGCPPTGQWLHYTAMCHYRALGKTCYDLGGSFGPVPIPGHENHGVWRFKYGFQPEYVAFSGFWIRTLRRLDATIQGWARQARKSWSDLGREG